MGVAVGVLVRVAVGVGVLVRVGVWVKVGVLVRVGVFVAVGVLVRVADGYDEEVDMAVEALTSIIEPIMIVMLALIIGTIVIAMFVPLISIVSEMS